MELKVEGAALHPQTLQEAPANITILTAEDLYKYGYRTLGEALASVRGFYRTNDRTYQTVGVRGFGLPGDYASRILVMVNGHNMADNVFDSMLWFGVDFPIDMSLVKRVEIIRGPTSALYGSNGIFATINVITKGPNDLAAAEMTMGAGSFGEKNVQLSTALALGKEARVLVSGTVFNNAGESPLEFPQFGADRGLAVRMDGERGYHFFSTLAWRNWNITAVLSERDKIQPISWGDTIFNDRGTQVIEPSRYLEAVYTREAGSRTLRWRTYYNATHLRGRFEYPLDQGVEDNRTCSCGDWIGTQLSYRFDIGRLGMLTAGTEAKADIRVLQSSGDVSPVRQAFVNIDRRDRSLAFFAQHELSLSRAWKLDTGLRLDTSAYRRSFLSPRAAVIYQASAGSAYKVLYGRAFRNPSAFHLFYEDGLSAMANPHLRPENADTVEVNAIRAVGKRWNILAAGYGYWLRDLLNGAYTANGLLRYENLGGARAAGVEFEIGGRPANWLEMTGSYTFQRSTDQLTQANLPNSADHQAKLRFAVPFGRKLNGSSSMQYYGSRDTLRGTSLAPAYLADFTVSSHQLSRNFDFRAGIRNALNRRYFDPIALNSRVDSMQQAGRVFFVELIAHIPE